MTRDIRRGPDPTTGLPPAKKRLFLALTILAPFALLAALEGALRLAWTGGNLAAFQSLTIGGRPLRMPSPRVARRYFANEDTPPAPPADLFTRDKPAHALRIFVLGESSAAGFPYPHNGTFSRVLRDALRDVLPDDSVEVVNLGIAATSSYTVDDLGRDVIDQQPDAVLIYAGHNEYYGALGVGSSIRFGPSPARTRAYLAAQRLRTVLLLRNVVSSALHALHGGAPVDSAAASFMESIAADQEITLESAAYRAGLAQFHDNIGRALSRFRDAHVPVFMASIASNEREQPPFVSAANGPARAAYDSALHALASGDSARARPLFARARDLDVVRFRAPSALNDSIRALASSHGAHYVAAAESLYAHSPGGMPGHELFLEHLHPNTHGTTLIASAFYGALSAEHFLGRHAMPERLAPWTEYERRMEISPFDARIVTLTVQSLTTRWPFVSRADAKDFRGTYRPTDLGDTLAMMVARGGMAWGEAKLRLATHLEEAHQLDAALAEYRGLLRDNPFAEPPYRLVGRTLFALGLQAEAVPYLQRAAALAPSWETLYLLGMTAVGQKDYPHAIALLDSAVTLGPRQVAPVYQLSLAFGLSHNLAAARAAAARAMQIDPRYPGLADWMTVLGMRAP